MLVFRQYLPGVHVKLAGSVAERMMTHEGRRLYVFTRELLKSVQEAGLKSALISGTPEVVAQAFASALKVEIFLGTEFPERNGIYIEGQPKLWVVDKGLAIAHLANLHTLKLEDSLAIGDSEGDIPMFQRVRWPICFNPDKVLLQAARENRWPVVIERKNVILWFRPDSLGKLHEIALAEIMPEWLASHLHDRLRPWSCP